MNLLRPETTPPWLPFSDLYETSTITALVIADYVVDGVPVPDLCTREFRAMEAELRRVRRARREQVAA